MNDIIRVSANSLTTAVAGAIAGVIRDRGQADVQAIGASAVNQAVKAIAIARGYLREEGVQIVCVPYFVEVRIGENERTAIRLSVTKAETIERALTAAENAISEPDPKPRGTVPGENLAPAGQAPARTLTEPSLS